MKCVVCNRVPAKEVFRLTHQVLNGKIDKETIHKICCEMVNMINYVDQKHRIFFCGHSRYGIIGGLVYLKAKENDISLTQEYIADSFGSHPSGFLDFTSPNTTTITIRKHLYRWLKSFPELFPKLTFTKKNKYLRIEAQP